MANPNPLGSIDPPSSPFSSSLSRDGSPSSSMRKLPELETKPSNLSLSVNYLPTKFSASPVNPSHPRRRRKKGDPRLPKLGGGAEAFRSGEARMPVAGDEDYDGVQGGWFGGGDSTGKTRKKKLRWNRFKWALFIANTVLTLYTIVGLIFVLLTWFDVFYRADIVRIANTSELVISTIAACLGILTSIVGWAGILMNNRSFLAVYSFLLWIVFIFLVAPGYMTYRRLSFNLEGKVNAQWSRDLGTEGRMRIQNQLQCCGYFSPFVEATVSQTCYARSVLPGCKLAYLDFQRTVLKRWYTVSFALVPVQLFIMITGLLCSNHVTYRFGKGMMPKAYRLSLDSMAVIMDNYATQLAEQYGSDIAEDILTRSRSNLNLQLEALPTVPYSSSRTGSLNTKYESVGSRAPEGAM
ncbi:hypothetical protein BDQ12DRAFT_684281 [Crucibulum laeve]|uniref:Tetraspanin Tsp2 family n=1 Tax=Crucibulum laeve TaxID=68775 RepID=A0A5C3M0P8_9AGAR|nr:hypothetical protein BDQ12DRAFT_684281 [Crucibulum laeve]